MAGISVLAASPTAAFLAALHVGCDGLLELRALPSRARAFLRLRDTAGVEVFVDRKVFENVYIAVATRIDASSGTLENCYHLGALYVDVDFKMTPEADARGMLAAFRLPPSAV